MILVKQWRIGLVAIIVSAAAAVIVVSQIDLNLLKEALKTARYQFVFPCAALLLVGLLVRGLRWQHLLSYDLRFRRVFHIMNVAYLVNSLLPLRLGEVARAYLATRADPPVPVFKSLTTVVVERLLDLLAVVMLVAIGLIAGPVPSELRYAGAFFGVVGFAGFAMLVLLSRQRAILHRLLAFVTDRITALRRVNVQAWLDHFLDGLLPLASINSLITALVLTALGWLFSVTAGYILMYTFFDDASWAATCLYIAAAALAIAVPAVPGSLGTYELSIIVALEALGYGDPSTRAVMFAVTVHAVNLLVHLGTGFLGFIAEGITLQQLQEGVSHVAKPADVGERT